jgi:hypothetical protein
LTAARLVVPKPPVSLPLVEEVAQRRAALPFPEGVLSAILLERESLLDFRDIVSSDSPDAPREAPARADPTPVRTRPMRPAAATKSLAVETRRERLPR